MSIRSEYYRGTVAERVRRAERARDDANFREYAAKQYSDSINWRTGTVWRNTLFGWDECGEVLKDGRITWYGKIAGRVIDGRPVYRKEFEENNQ